VLDQIKKGEEEKKRKEEKKKRGYNNTYKVFLD
jgi:hypothetical protein